MAALFINIIVGLSLVAALGILGLVVGGCVAKAYGETILTKRAAASVQAPKYQRYGHFLWKLGYPVIAVFGICIKVMAEFLGNNSKTEEETRWHDGIYWKRSSAGTWYSYGADEDDYPPPL